MRPSSTATIHPIRWLPSLNVMFAFLRSLTCPNPFYLDISIGIISKYIQNHLGYLCACVSGNPINFFIHIQVATHIIIN